MALQCDAVTAPMRHVHIPKHHAVVFEGDRDVAHEAALEYVESTLDVAVHANVDVLVTDHERLSIEEARDLKTRAFRAPIGSRQVLILRCGDILHEAQNALLKLLEEPPLTTHLILIVPSVHMLLPTVRSRMLYAGLYQRTVPVNDTGQRFLVAALKERLAMVDRVLKGKERAPAQTLLDEIERAVRTTSDPAMLRELVFVRGYARDRGSSQKMLLQHLAHTLPQVSVCTGGTGTPRQEAVA